MNHTAFWLLEEALRANGYAGLYSGDDPCGCTVGDLMPCDQTPTNCRGGYRQPDGTIGPTPPVTHADLEAAGQQRLFGAHEEESE